MKNSLLIFNIILILSIFITSCADREETPAAVIYTREPAEIETTIEATTEASEIIEVIEDETTTIPETTTIITTVITTESIPTPVTELPAIVEPDLYKSTGDISIILNINSGIYHTKSDCSQVTQILDENKREFGIDDISVMAEYTVCDECNTVAETTAPPETNVISEDGVMTVLVNLNTGTFHADLTCRHIKTMKEENKGDYTGTIEEIKSAGYTACGTCSKQYRD